MVPDADRILDTGTDTLPERRASERYNGSACIVRKFSLTPGSSFCKRLPASNPFISGIEISVITDKNWLGVNR